MGSGDYTSLMERWRRVPDPRKARGRRYEWALLLTLITLAMASGEKTVQGMGDWVLHREAELRKSLGLGEGRLPSTDTLRRALANVDIEALEREVRNWSSEVAVDEGDPQALRAVAIDGKAVRGAGRHDAPLCLVGFVEHGTGRVIDQEAVADKSNEITAVPALLERAGVPGLVITMDALLTQRTIAKQILTQGMDYLMVAKDNQPRLLTAISAHFEDGPPDLTIRHHERVEKGHGRIERRILDVTDAPSDWVGWPGAQQILRRTVYRTTISTGKTSRSVTYGVTSLGKHRADAAQLEQLWRGHWTTENPVHYVRDVSMGEDLCQVRCGNAPRALAALRNAVLNVLRTGPWRSVPAAQRAMAADLNRAVQFFGGVPAAVLFT